MISLLKRCYFLPPLFLQKFIWIPTWVLLRFFGRLEIRGLENLAELKTNAIFACNHTSEMDVLLVPSSLPFFSRFSPIFYTSLEHKYYSHVGWRKVFYGGNFFKIWGAYAVKRGLENYGEALFRQINIINDGGNICFFPEGRITRDGNLQEAKGGVAYLAYSTGVPIVPVYLGGAYQISAVDLFLRRRKLSISYGKPMYVVGTPGEPMSLNEYKAQAALVMQKVGEMKM